MGVKTGFQTGVSNKAAVSRAVGLRECLLRELRLYSIVLSSMMLFKRLDGLTRSLLRSRGTRERILILFRRQKPKFFGL